MSPQKPGGKVMKAQNRVEITDCRRGRYVIAERLDGGVEFFEKEFGGVQWYTFRPTSDIEEAADQLFRRADMDAIGSAAA
jgi:hypothetical protein